MVWNLGYMITLIGKELSVWSQQPVRVINCLHLFNHWHALAMSPDATSHPTPGTMQICFPAGD